MNYKSFFFYFKKERAAYTANETCWERKARMMLYDSHD